MYQFIVAYARVFRVLYLITWALVGGAALYTAYSEIKARRAGVGPESKPWFLGVKIALVCLIVMLYLLAHIK